jgi:hypothetical protein
VGERREKRTKERQGEPKNVKGDCIRLRGTYRRTHDTTAFLRLSDVSFHARQFQKGSICFYIMEKTHRSQVFPSITENGPSASSSSIVRLLRKQLFSVRMAVTRPGQVTDYVQVFSSTLAILPDWNDEQERQFHTHWACHGSQQQQQRNA